MSNFDPNPGTIESKAGSLVTINGNLTQEPGSVINLDLGGTLTAQFGRIAVTGQMTFSGTLNINLVNVYNPLLNNSFQMITYDSHTGTFTSSNLPPLDPGLIFQENYNATDYTLEVISN